MSFRDYLIAKRGTVNGSLIESKPQPIFTPTEKRPGDLVLGAGGKWSVVA